jgi:hypothetical protein
MNKIVFEPWIGSQFNSANTKILVLGESHYGDVSPDDWNDFTNYIVKKYLGYKNGNEKHESWMNTFTRFSNIVTSNMDTKIKTTTFWESIIFYNYIQKPLCSSRLAPTQDEFVNSAKAFEEIISTHKPDEVIVWGKRLWDYLLSSNILFHDDVNNQYFIKSNDGLNASKVYHVYHPSSSYFNYNYWANLKRQIKL